jgi:hypothetical protein
MRVIVGCENSGIIRDAFEAHGHSAMSCDLLPSDRPGNHYQGDVRDLFGAEDADLFIVHPDCTYICGSGWHWNNRRVGRHMQSLRAIDFFAQMLNAPFEKVAAENPVGAISSHIRKPDQYIQPHQFGHDASKKTGLWLKGLDKLEHTKVIPGREVVINGKTYYRWANQTDSGQNALPPSKDRWKLRAETYQGWADAMARQWGGKQKEELQLELI